MTDSQCWPDFLDTFIERYPAAEAQDVYTAMVEAYKTDGLELKTEFALVKDLGERVKEAHQNPKPWEDIIEALGESGHARIHLVPYVRAGGDLDKLAAAVVRTREQRHDESRAHQDLAMSLGSIRGELRVNDRGIDLKVLDRLLHRGATEGFPWLGASTSFHNAYGGVYVVVRPELMA